MTGNSVLSGPVSVLEPKLFYRRMEIVFREVATFGGSEPFARSFSAGQEFLAVFALEQSDLGEPALSSVFSSLRYAIALNLRRLELQTLWSRRAQSS